MPLSADGKVDVFNFAGHADVVIDVVGYFTPGTGLAFHAVVPSWIFDTRPSSEVGQYDTPIGPGEVGLVPVTEVGDARRRRGRHGQRHGDRHDGRLVPGAVARRRQLPGESSLNWTAGEIIANSVTIDDDRTGQTWIGNYDGYADIIIDVSGWYG